MLPSLVAVLLLAQCTGACDQAGPSAHPTPDARMGTAASDQTVETGLIHRAYGMGGQAMRRGLVPFGDRVLVVARPSDDKTPQHVLAVSDGGQAEYLKSDGAFAPLPQPGVGLETPAVLRGEGVEADYADGLLALLNSDSLSDWTDSGFLDWGRGRSPSGAPSSWSTTVPLVWRESHQRTVAVLGPDTGADGTLVVGHVGRFFKDKDQTQPVPFPSAMVSTDRGRTWVWGPSAKGKAPSGAYAAAWPDAPGGGRVLYFPVLLPTDRTVPPLAVFSLDPGEETGVRLDVPYERSADFWGDYGFSYAGKHYPPQTVRHWVTSQGLFLDASTVGLFWMDAPDATPRQVATGAPETQALYFSHGGHLMRVAEAGTVERLEDPASASWAVVGQIDRPAGAEWVQAAASDGGALWLLGKTDGDVAVATWPAGQAF